MNWKVNVRPRAAADIRAAQNWYEEQREGLGNEFLASVADTLASLEERPDQLPEYYNGFHRALTARFPYKIFFRLEGDLVLVFRVLHAAREHAALLDREQ